MENAKSAFGSCELPTGVYKDRLLKEVVYREMSGQEEDVLASRTLTASQKITQIIAGCIREFDGEADPYAVRQCVDKLVITDRWYLLTKIRSHSLGPQYEFKAKCPSCEHIEKLTANLNETKVTNPPKATELFQEIALPSGKKVRWRVADTTVETNIEKLSQKNPDKAATVALFSRVTEVDGQPATLHQILNLSMRDRQALRKAIDENEGNFEDEFDATCSACGHDYKVELQLEAESFFYPSATS